MKYTIDTVNKTIQIEEATIKELKKLCKDYEGFTIASKVINNWNYPYYPVYPSYPLEPFYITSDTSTVSDIDLTAHTTGEIFTIN